MRSTASQFLSWRGTPASRCQAAGSEEHDVLRLKSEQRATATLKLRNPVPPWRPTDTCKFGAAQRITSGFVLLHTVCVRTHIRVHMQDAAKIRLLASITSEMGAPVSVTWHRISILASYGVVFKARWSSDTAQTSYRKGSHPLIRITSPLRRRSAAVRTGHGVLWKRCFYFTCIC